MDNPYLLTPGGHARYITAMMAWADARFPNSSDVSNAGQIENDKREARAEQATRINSHKAVRDEMGLV